MPGCPSSCLEQSTMPTMFERMSAIHEEIAEIENRLHSLRATENTIAEISNVAGSAGDLDPSVAHMLSVELCQLAGAGDTVGVRMLLNGGADYDCRDYDKRTPLHIASTKGHVHVVRLLLDFGADPTLIDKDGKTPLNLAEENECNEVLQLLLTHCASRHQTDAAGKTENVVLDGFSGHGHPDFSQVPQPMMGSLIVIMVGLSGRGKTYIARQIQRYFQWNGLCSEIFVYSEYRERLAPGYSSPPTVSVLEVERRIAASIVHDMARCISHADTVAVLDGTNSSPMRHVALLNAIKEAGLVRPSRVVFVEVVNNDAEMVRQNVNHAKDMLPNAPENFVDAYYEKIAKQETLYRTLSPITDKDMTYIRIEDRVVFSLNNISGWMPSRLAYMLHNLSHFPNSLYLTRAGEYVDLVAGRIGGNSPLTERGKAYSEALFEYFQREMQMKPLVVISGCALRCIETVSLFEEQSLLLHGASAGTVTQEPKLNCRVSYLPTLDDINHGDCDGQLISDVRRTMPNTLKRMRTDPYHTAWPNGECIHQVFNARLEPHIHDIQASTNPVLVVSHLHLLQGLYSYFVTEKDKAVAPQDAHEIDIPFECVIKIHPVGFDRVAEVIDLSDEVDQISLRRTGSTSGSSHLKNFNIFRALIKESAGDDKKRKHSYLNTRRPTNVAKMIDRDERNNEK